jgi:hypothetical protein
MVGVVLYTDPGDDGPKEAQGSKPYPGPSGLWFASILKC